MKVIFALLAAVLVASASAMPNFLHHALQQLPRRNLRTESGVRQVRRLEASSCTKDGWHASNVEVSVSPDNPKKGGEYTLKSSYTLDETVSAGSTAVYKGTLNGFTVMNDDYDLCNDILAGGDTPCPLGPGDIDSSSTDTVPDWVPSGALELKITWKDQNKENVLCIDFTIHVS